MDYQDQSEQKSHPIFNQTDLEQFTQYRQMCIYRALVISFILNLFPWFTVCSAKPAEINQGSNPLSWTRVNQNTKSQQVMSNTKNH